jgi:hypothetical protein
MVPTRNRYESSGAKATTADLHGTGLVLQRVTIGSLPDDVLLETFHFYHDRIDTQSWHTLVYICRRWRYIVFASPLRLNLVLVCTPGTPVRKLLDIWPALPLVIHIHTTRRKLRPPKERLKDLIAALEHRDRVRQVKIVNSNSSPFGPITTEMQEPLPALTSLELSSKDDVLPISDTFLNGSAPSLQHLSLKSISFPSLPELLLSASDLKTLKLDDIPNTGYVSPEAMATCLSTLTHLETLFIKFRCQTPHPNLRSRSPLPLTRTVLSALTKLDFLGVSEYFEVLAARIDAPLLDHIVITFFDQVVFCLPQIARFFSRIMIEFSDSSNLSLTFYPNRHACVSSHWSKKRSPVTGFFRWYILCKEFDLQVSSIAKMCTHILPLVSTVENLNIVYGIYWGIDRPLGIRPEDMDPTRWMELFNSFSSVQRLEVPAELEPFIAAALQGLTRKSAAEVLPALKNLFIRGPTTGAAQRGIESFVTARRHSNHFVILHRR